jgi:hypothetical protein
MIISIIHDCLMRNKYVLAKMSTEMLFN